MFDRAVDAKGKKREEYEETVRAYLTMITKNNRTKKVCTVKGTDFSGQFKNFAKLKEYKYNLH